MSGEQRWDGGRRARVRESVMRPSTQARVRKQTRHVASSHRVSQAVGRKASVRSAPQPGPPTEASTAEIWSPTGTDQRTGRWSPRLERVRSDTVSARHNLERADGMSQLYPPPQPYHADPCITRTIRMSATHAGLLEGRAARVGRLRGRPARVGRLRSRAGHVRRLRDRATHVRGIRGRETAPEEPQRRDGSRFQSLGRP